MIVFFIMRSSKLKYCVSDIKIVLRLKKFNRVYKISFLTFTFRWKRTLCCRIFNIISKLTSFRAVIMLGDCSFNYILFNLDSEYWLEWTKRRQEIVLIAILSYWVYFVITASKEQPSHKIYISTIICLWIIRQTELLGNKMLFARILILFIYNI